MKIIYRQNPEDNGNSPFFAYGIKNCYFKHIYQTVPDGSSTKKRHSHTGYEFHLIIEGRQRYETCDGDFEVGRGCFLAIPKGRSHKLACVEYPINKYAFTFSFDEKAQKIFEPFSSERCLMMPIPARVLSDLSAAAAFSRKSTPLSARLLENCVLETVILLLKEIGAGEREVVEPKSTEKIEDGRVEIAKQYVSDNIESPITVSEVAAYCYVSEKHLTRLFYCSEKISPAAYVRRERIRHIEELLRTSELSLCEISRRMGFPNESGFNAFFKKYNGMPSGEYRKMIR